MPPRITPQLNEDLEFFKQYETKSDAETNEDLAFFKQFESPTPEQLRQQKKQAIIDRDEQIINQALAERQTLGQSPMINAVAKMTGKFAEAGRGLWTSFLPLLPEELSVTKKLRRKIEEEIDEHKIIIEEIRRREGSPLKPSEQTTLAEKLGDFAGTGAQMMSATKIASVLGPKILGKTVPALASLPNSLKRVATATSAGAIYGAATGSEDKRLQASLTDAVTFGALDAAFTGVGGALSKAAEKIRLTSTYQDFAKGFPEIKDKLFTTVDSFLRKQGMPGVQLAQKLQGARDYTERHTGEFIADLTSPKHSNPGALNALGKEAYHKNPKMQTLIQMLNSPATTDNLDVKKAWGVVRRHLNTIFTEAKNRGLVTDFTFRDNYFPHIGVHIDTLKNLNATETKDVIHNMVSNLGIASEDEAKKLINAWVSFVETEGGMIGNTQLARRNYKDIIDWMIKTKQAKTPQGAENTLRAMIKHSDRRYPYLEKARTVDLPFWDPDPRRVLPKYYFGAWKRLAEVDHFGREDVLAYELVNRINQNGGNGKLAENAFDRIVGKELPIEEKEANLFKHLISLEVALDLGMAFIANSTQSVSTFIHTGLNPAMKSMKGMIGSMERAEAYDFAMRSGALLERTLHELQFSLGAGKRGIGSFVLDVTGFNKFEAFNRVFSANTGREYAEKLTADLLRHPTLLTRRKISELGINPQKIVNRGSISDEELYTAAKRVADRTQLRSGALDMPYFATSPYGRLIYQFKSFAIGNAKFLKKMVWDEARRGNYQPLMRAAVGLGLSGEAILDLKKLAGVRDKDRPGVLTIERWLENIAYAGSLGIFSDILQSSLARNFGEFVAGPVISRTIRNVENVATGTPQTVINENLPVPIKQWFKKHQKENRKFDLE